MNTVTGPISPNPAEPFEHHRDDDGVKPPWGGELYAINGLRRIFGHREVLAIDRLDIEPGLIYGLMGPNGSGKTTLMKLLAFLDTPSAGTITFKGRPVTEKNMAGFRSQVVWSPQFPVMFTGSLRYNVEYPMKIKGIPAAARRSRALELLEQVGLQDLADSPARRLSGGEAQRASLARALAAGAEVLLLDEPTANVDAASRRDLVRLVDDLWRERKLSVIITTHDASLEAELCRRRIKLADGRLASLEDTAVYPAALSGDGQTLILPPEAPAASGPLTVTELAARPGGARVVLAAADGRTLTVLVDEARGLTLGHRLTTRSKER